MHRQLPATLLFLLFLVLPLVPFALPASAHAQGAVIPPQVQPGARVRATAPRVQTVTGLVVAANGDTLHVLRDYTRDTSVVVISRLTALDLSTGRHKRRVLGAVYGLFGGAALGAVIGAVSYRKQTCAPGTFLCDYPGQAGDEAIGAVLLGGAGTIVGAIVGAGKADSWRRVIPRESAQVGLVVPGAAGRLAFGASLRF